MSSLCKILQFIPNLYLKWQTSDELGGDWMCDSSVSMKRLFNLKNEGGGAWFW